MGEAGRRELCRERVRLLCCAVWWICKPFYSSASPEEWRNAQPSAQLLARRLNVQLPGVQRMSQTSRCTLNLCCTAWKLARLDFGASIRIVETLCAFTTQQQFVIDHAL